ncbi:MAG TPA: WcaI family glycosyltransferase [Candidatus Tectomicrobia bacterium]|nr:WcaI family glycosyltransferase [Candidatus Tectomicrobia bacterium]
MRLLVLGINYWPEETGIAVFTTGRCEYLAAQGHEVMMVTGFPYYPQWRVHDGYRGRLFARETRHGVTILRCYLYVPRRVTTLSRVLHEASFLAFSLIRALGARQPELLLVVSPPLGLAISAVLLSRRWGIPYVFHVADLQPDAALELGMLPEGRLLKGLYRLESQAYRQAALVSTLTEAMRQRILTKGVPADKVERSSDWADPTLFAVPPVGGGAAFRRAFGLEDRFLVVHIGNMGVKQGLEVVLAAAERSSGHPALTFLLVGDGAMRQTLEACATALRFSNLQFLPLQRQDMFRELLAAADLCLVTQQRTVADIVFPSKVITLLAAGRPVVASVNSRSEVARVITEAGGGVVVRPEEPEALLEALLVLSQDTAGRHAMGARGRAYARQHWDRGQILPTFETQLLSIVEQGQLLRKGLGHSSGKA